MSDAEALFSPGVEVEVTSDEEGYRGVWFEAHVISFNPRRNVYIVEYDAILDHRCRHRLRELFAPDRIRPRPPSFRSADSACPPKFDLYERVDALHNDGWWEGVVYKVVEDKNERRYWISFPETDDEQEFGAAEIRPHLEWVNGQWKIPEKMSDMDFKPGMMVECRTDDTALHGSWYSATIIKCLRKEFLVEHKYFTTDGGTELLRETVDSMHIRPTPPNNSAVGKFKLLEEVDAFCNNGWRIGVISKVLRGQRYMVYFKDGQKEVEFGCNDLRLHHDWIHGRWSKVSQALDL